MVTLIALTILRSGSALAGGMNQMNVNALGGTEGDHLVSKDLTKFPTKVPFKHQPGPEHKSVGKEAIPS